MTSDETPAAHNPVSFRALLDRLCGHRRRWSDHETQVKTPLEQGTTHPTQNEQCDTAAPQIPEIAGLEISRDRSQERDLVTEEELDAVSAVSEGVIYENVVRGRASGEGVSVVSTASKDEETKMKERKSLEAKHRREESWQNRGLGVGKTDWAKERAEADSKEVVKPLPALPMEGVVEGKEEDNEAGQKALMSDPQVEAKARKEWPKGEQAPWNKTIEASDQDDVGEQTRLGTEKPPTTEEPMLSVASGAAALPETAPTANKTVETESAPEKTATGEQPDIEAPPILVLPAQSEPQDEVDAAAGAPLPDSRSTSIDEEELIPAVATNGAHKPEKGLVETIVETKPRGLGEVHTPVMEATSGPLMDYYSQ